MLTSLPGRGSSAQFLPMTGRGRGGGEERKSFNGVPFTNPDCAEIVSKGDVVIKISSVVGLALTLFVVVADTFTLIYGVV